MKAKTKAWLEVTESDLKAAKTLLSKRHYLQTIFLSHQALEKYLKALVQEVTDETPKFTHDFALLMKQSKAKFPDAMEESLLRLSPHYLGTRYPEEIAKFRKYYNRTFALAFLSDTQEIIEWLKENYLG
jgi:HEPN domain-containing protein